MAAQKTLFSKSGFALLVFIGILLNATCFFNDILEPDGTLYAFIAKQIAQSNDWINLWDKGRDWLDKPHLPFWLAAVSFKIFGISSFAYKLPSFICWLIGMFYCYKLSAKLYNTAIAQLTTIIYSTSLYVIVANFDVRAEAYLTAFIIGATYHIYKAFDKKWFLHILTAAIFCACAIMTKGIFTVITIAAGFIIYWIKTKQWNEFIKLKWYLLAALTFIFILPELYSLYMQFDLHPEKIVFGKKNVSGLKFFFWDSQFGRFVNTGPIKGNGNFFFFFHTILWEFMPWIVFLIIALIALFKKINKPSLNNQRWIIGSSALITFLLFSFSKFQLPHYLIIIFPHLSMITACWIMEDATETALKKLAVVQTVMYLLLSALIITLAVIFVFNYAIWLYIFLIAGLLFIFFYKTKTELFNIIKKNIVFAFVLAIFLNFFFYPSILPYQSGMTAGKWLNNNWKAQQVNMYKCYTNSLEFYCAAKVLPVGNLDSLVQVNAGKDSLLLFTPINEVSAIQQNNSMHCLVLKTFSHFHISQVTAKFLNHETRNSVLDTFAVVSIKRKLLFAE